VLVQQQLNDEGLTVNVRELPDSARTAAEAAAALNCEVGAIASSLVFLADDVPLLVMTSGRHRVDTALLASSADATKIEMATAKQVRAIAVPALDDGLILHRTFTVINHLNRSDTPLTRHSGNLELGGKSPVSVYRRHWGARSC
jgi:hypothetical protein